MIYNENQRKMRKNSNMEFVQAWFVDWCPRDMQAEIIT